MNIYIYMGFTRTSFLLCECMSHSFFLLFYFLFFFNWLSYLFTFQILSPFLVSPLKFSLSFREILNLQESQTKSEYFKNILWQVHLDHIYFSCPFSFFLLRMIHSSYLHNLFVFHNNLPSPVSDISIHTSLGPSTGTWYQGYEHP